MKWLGTKWLWIERTFLLLALMTVIHQLTPPVFADELAQTMVRLDRMSAGSYTGMTVCFKLAAPMPDQAYLFVTFPTEYSDILPSVWSSVTLDTNNLPAGSTALNGATFDWAGSDNGQIRLWIPQFTSLSNLYCLHIDSTNELVNPATPATNLVFHVGVGSPFPPTPFGFTGDTAVSVISNDQITVTAAVDPTFTFSLSSNAQALGTLSTASVRAGSGVAATVTTNAGAGWTAWVKSANAALTSLATGGSIPTTGSLDNSPTQLVAGTPGYVVDADLTTDDATAGSGAVSIASEYNGTLSNSGGTLSSIFQPFAFATGPTTTDVITLVPRVTISGLTPAAGDYTDTLTVVAAGSF